MRYLAVTGPPEAVRQWLTDLIPCRTRLLTLNRVFDGGDLVVYASPATPLVHLEEERGVVIGRMFRGADAPEPVQRLTLSQSRHAAWSGGRSLLEQNWGGYVAFVRHERKASAFRDPSGAMAAYYRPDRGIHLYVSHPELLGGLALGASAVDEEYLRQWLTYPFLRTARTGASDWRELLPGTWHATGDGDPVLGLGWSPWKIVARDEAAHDFDEAARRLRERALATVAIQLRGLHRPTLELSGGLDSSIVAACLASGGANFEAVNFATLLPDGDERAYARSVAAAFGVALAELVEHVAPLDLSPPRWSLRPPSSPVLQPLHRARTAFARTRGVSDFVSGGGGDNLFCYLTTTAPVLDAMAAGGWQRGIAALHDVAALGEATLWKAAAYSLRKQLRRARRPRWKRETRFVAPAALADAPDDHPWLDPPQGAAAGKIEHVESLVRAQYFLSMEYPAGEPVYYPLLNQPLMELCLATPTWFWVQGGQNRAVARAAFRDLLPADVIGRRTKGRLESMCARAFADNRHRLSEFLLEGELARRHLLDLPLIEAYLKSGDKPRDEAYYRLFDLVSLELWLRSWRD